MKIERPKPVVNVPKNATRVFDGILFDVYQWEQEQFDGSTKTFEILKRTDTVMGVPVTKNGKIIGSFGSRSSHLLKSTGPSTSL